MAPKSDTCRNSGYLTEDGVQKYASAIAGVSKTPSSDNIMDEGEAQAASSSQDQRGDEEARSPSLQAYLSEPDREGSDSLPVVVEVFEVSPVLVVTGPKDTTIADPEKVPIVTPHLDHQEFIPFSERSPTIARRHR